MTEYILRFPLRDFLAAKRVTQAGAARAIGVNHYTLNSWITAGRVPLIACKALAEVYDPQHQTSYLPLDQYAPERLSGAKRPSHTAHTSELAARYDARHGDPRDKQAPGEVTCDVVEAPVPALASDVVDSIRLSGTPASLSRAGARVTAPVAAPMPAVGTLPPESELLMSLLLQIAKERDAALSRKRELESLASSLESQVLELEVAVEGLNKNISKLEADVADWMALAEERTSAAITSRETAVANVRAALEEKAPDLVVSLHALLGN